MTSSVSHGLRTPRDILSQRTRRAVDRDARTAEALVQAAQYVSSFLTQPHASLGRPGAVCPFMAAALRRDMVGLIASPLRLLDKAALVRTVSELCFHFADGGTTRSEMYRAVVMVFPHLPAQEAASLIAAVQKELKPDFTEQGLMLGEFFPGCPSPGLHNPDFRPFDTRFASLAVRRMTISDAPFMLGDDRFVSHYVKRFQEEGLQRLSELRPSDLRAPG